MTPTWTGRPGSPTPAILRHDLAPCGERQRRCTRCERCWLLDGLPDPMALCPAAVAQRLSELEAHGASIHKAVARSRRGIVRWLRDKTCYDAEHDGRWCPTCNQDDDRADAIDRGDDAAWCEANPEIPPATEDKP